MIFFNISHKLENIKDNVEVFQAGLEASLFSEYLMKMSKDNPNLTLDQLKPIVAFPKDFVIASNNIVEDNIIVLKKHKILSLDHEDIGAIEDPKTQKTIVFFIDKQTKQLFVSENIDLLKRRKDRLEKDNQNILKKVPEGVVKWLISNETGLSSMTLAVTKYPEIKSVNKFLERDFSYPYDSSDFGRILKFQEAAQLSNKEMIDLMDKAGDKVPQYKELKNHFVQMKSLMTNFQDQEQKIKNRKEVGEIIKNCVEKTKTKNSNIKVK